MNPGAANAPWAAQWNRLPQNLQNTLGAIPQNIVNRFGAPTPAAPATPMPARVAAKSGGRLTAKQRQALPKSSFALPGKGKGPKGAGAGSYPINDRSHAQNALARVSQHGTPAEKAAVRAKVHAKYPDMGKK